MTTTAATIATTFSILLFAIRVEVNAIAKYEMSFDELSSIVQLENGKLSISPPRSRTSFSWPALIESATLEANRIFAACLCPSGEVCAFSRVQ